MIVIGNAYHGRLIATLAGVDYDDTRCPCIVRFDSGGRFLGGVLYTDYTGVSMRIHMGGKARGWANRKLIEVAFDYPFNQLKVEKLFATVKSTAKQVLEIDRRLGFKEIYRMPGAVPDGDLVLLSMSRDECRWLNKTQLAVEEAA